MSKSKITENAMEAELLQFAADIPLAKRTKTEERKYNAAKKLTKELDEESWNKATKLVKGKWYPFNDNRWECFSPRKFGTYGGIGSPLRLMYEFKRAVLSQNWTNALKLANSIFKNYHTFIQRSHIKVMLTVLLSHPGVNEAIVSDLCSYLWRLEDNEKKADLLQCFCSLPKNLPNVALLQGSSHTNSDTVFQRTKGGQKSTLATKYTACIGKDEENDMYVE